MRERGIVAVLELREDIGLISLRALAPEIGRLRRRHALDVLGMEALVAAVHLEADVVLSTPSPRLETALGAEQRGCHILI